MECRGTIRRLRTRPVRLHFSPGVFDLLRHVNFYLSSCNIFSPYQQKYQAVEKIQRIGKRWYQLLTLIVRDVPPVPHNSNSSQSFYIEDIGTDRLVSLNGRSDIQL